MFVAYRDHGCVRVPGAVLEWLEIPGHGEVGISSAPAYLDVDGSIAPGYTNSPIRTDIRYTHYPEDGTDYESNRRVRPVVCKVCHDDGQSLRHTFGNCEVCEGWGSKKNLHICALCGEASAEVLPVAPRATLNHELLLPRMHPACAIESLQAELPSGGPVVRESAAA